MSITKLRLLKAKSKRLVGSFFVILSVMRASPTPMRVALEKGGMRAAVYVTIMTDF
jgi:hypothetical protein